jgi:outer membrane protein TolC
MLALGQEREKLKLQLGENRILPKVDFVAEGGRDIGGGLANRAGNEAKIGFNVSIPLQQNIGRGQMAEARAKLKQIEQKQRLLGDKIAAEIRAVANDFDAAKQYRSLTEQEVAAARKMEAAERQRFDDGLSDFFVINMREERTASARLSNLAANTKFWKAVADYYLATLKPEKLLITDADIQP